MGRDILHQNIDKLLKLQLCDEHPVPSKPITKFHSSTLTLDNSLQFLVDFLVTQIHKFTSIVLGLSWLCSINLNIDWATLTMKFNTPRAKLAAAIHLQCPSEHNDPVTPSLSTDSTTTPATLGLRPMMPLKIPIQCPPNIPRNKYKGPYYFTQNSWTPPDLSEDEEPPPFTSSNAFDIKIISAATFAHILQRGTDDAQFFSGIGYAG
ncbi:hypothetical protein C0992_001413 [Termitomyces sp. T32_za158]|nr:hypothetical protein C0992_001413 [Termitomyces sp. T32_za158]